MMLLPATENLEAEFRRCWPWLEASMVPSAYHHDGRVYHAHSFESILKRVLDGRAHLWPGEASGTLTEILRHPTGLVSQNNWLAGGDLEEIVSITGETEIWGREQGCHRQIGSGRRGWLKAFTGYVETGVRKQKDLWLPGEAPKGLK